MIPFLNLKVVAQGELRNSALSSGEWYKIAVLGDSVYGEESLIAKRQMLHAFSLEFLHPISKKIMKLKAQLPKDFLEVLNRIKKL